MKKYILTLLFSVFSALAFCALDYSGQDSTGNYFGYKDLTGADFTHADLTLASFENATVNGADFTHADLTLADFWRANVSGANFTNANLASADFWRANVSGANFTNANLTSVRFDNATVSGANFTNADLTWVNFGNAKGLTIEQLRSAASIKNVNLYGRDMTNWDFSNLDLTSVGFWSANVSGANFTNANLISANFNNANVSGTNFTNANLRSAFFNDADLTDANFEGVDLTNANFQRTTNFTIPQNAIFNHTVMPDGSIRTDSVIIETSLPTSLILFENTTHNLEVSASEKDGKKLTYTWYVDKNNGKGFVKAGSKPMLAITPKANMVGWRYYCAVSNESETRNTSVSTIVAVKTPAKITGKPKALEAFEGVGNSGFKVLATGSDLKYQWQVYKVVGYNAKGKPIYDWVDIAGATSANYNPESSLENNGLKYRCKVYNDGSVAYTSGVKYTVREAPKVEGIEVLQCKEKLSFDGSTVVAYEDYPIDLQATAKGYKIKYQWYKNGAAIKGATKSKYTIKKPLESQDSYYCEVYNGDVKDQSSTFVLEVRECPMPASFEGHSLYVSDITDMGDPCRDMRMIFLNKNTLRVTMEDYEVSNPAWSYKRVSPTKAAVSLKFKLYTNDEPVSKLNTISYSYSGEIEFKDNVFRLDLSDKKNGSFSGSFTDADIESADKTSLLSLPISKKITVGEETLMLLDKKNFAMGEVSGTYTYKSNKNGTGVLKLNYKDGSDKCTAEISMLALSGNSGVAVVSTNWNEGKDKFISSDFEEFEIEN